MTGRPTYLDKLAQGPTVLAVDAGGGCLDIFSFVYRFSFLSLKVGPLGTGLLSPSAVKQSNPERYPFILAPTAKYGVC